MIHKPATPLPWQYGELSERVITPQGLEVCAPPEDSDGEKQSRADLGYIVHAANAYPKLVHALRDIATTSKGYPNASREGERASALLQELGEAP